MPPTQVPQTRPLFDQIDAWLTELHEVKSASAPKGAVKTALEGMGKTTHPSEKVDNYTHDTPEGARYKENTSDVDKAVQGDPVTGDSPVRADQDKVMPNIGVDQSATGEDSSIETKSVKGDKDDPGTSHPANADDVGQKYASLSIPALLKVAEDKANNILAHIAQGHFTHTPGQPAQRAPAVKQADAVAAQVARGYTDAANAGDADLEKVAAEFLEGIMRDADLDADLVGSALTEYYQHRHLQKKAEPDGAGEGEDHKPGDMPMPGMPPAGPAGMPPDAGMGGPGGPGGDPMAGGPGGAPGGDPAAGGDPMAALGAAAQDAPPHPSSGAGKEQALQDLVMALHELGLTEEDLAQLSQQGPAPEEGAKLASAAVRFRRSGKFRFEEAKTAQQRTNRNLVRGYVMELTNLK